jgi:hypothetical protein
LPVAVISTSHCVAANVWKGASMVNDVVQSAHASVNMTGRGIVETLHSAKDACVPKPCMFSTQEAMYGESKIRQIEPPLQRTSAREHTCKISYEKLPAVHRQTHVFRQTGAEAQTHQISIQTQSSLRQDGPCRHRSEEPPGSLPRSHARNHDAGAHRPFLASPKTVTHVKT